MFLLKFVASIVVVRVSVCDFGWHGIVWTVLVLLSMIFGRTCVVVDGAFGHVDFVLLEEEI